MRFANSVGAELSPRFDVRLSARGILSDLARVKFARPGSAEILRRHLSKHPEAAPFLDPESVERGGMAATPALLYAPPAAWDFGFFRRVNGGDGPDATVRSFRLPAPKVRSAAQVLRLLVSDAGVDEARNLAILRPEDFAVIFDAAAPRRRWPEPAGPGIYRREHASLLVQSEAARLVFDPVFMSCAVPAATTVLPDERVDAVLITHSHVDHWHVPSLLASARVAETVVVVPHVPKPTVLCPDLSAQLEAVGQRCAHPPWGTALRFGDIEVDVLPFYGEQPAVDARCPDADVRNWGNCYRVNTPEFSALILADSGVDPAGDMLDVVAESVAARGPIDVVIACMRDFLSPFEVGGLNTFWMTLPFTDLERLYATYEAGQLRTTTAGLSGGGLAAICAKAQARMFAPYAQGFAGIGNPIPAGGWGPSPTLSEAQALMALEEQLTGARTATAVQGWNPGDGLVPSGGTLQHRSG